MGVVFGVATISSVDPAYNRRTRHVLSARVSEVPSAYPGGVAQLAERRLCKP